MQIATGNSEEWLGGDYGPTSTELEITSNRPGTGHTQKSEVESTENDDDVKAKEETKNRNKESHHAKKHKITTGRCNTFSSI